MSDDFEAYRTALEARMDKGKGEYENKSWNAEPIKLLDEVMEELVDAAGWAGILWCRLYRMRRALAEQKSG